MDNDFLLSVFLLVVFLAVIVRGWFCYMVMEGLISLTRPGATIALLGLVLALYAKNFKMATLVAGIMSVFLLMDVWTRFYHSDDRRLYKDVQKDQARFDPSKSVDLQWANGSVTHDSPNMLHKDADTTPLLIFPPSTETLETMCG
jgi:hypothetical protein